MTRFPVNRKAGHYPSNLRYGTVLLADPYPEKRDYANGKKHNKRHYIVGNNRTENIKGGYTAKYSGSVCRVHKSEIGENTKRIANRCAQRADHYIAQQYQNTDPEGSRLAFQLAGYQG